MKKKSFYAKVKKLLGPLLKKVFRIRVKGIENIPENGQLLICSNHLSIADVILLGCVIPRELHFMAKKELFSVPVFGRFFKACGAVPVDRKGADVKAIKTMISLYESGQSICVYPQGHRYKGVHPKETSIKNGVGLISWRAKCDILPVGFYGKGWKLKPFRKNYMNIGEMIKFESLGMTEGNTAEYERVARIVFDDILSLLEGIEC